ncbi:MAG: response regulator [Phycisphaerales bacterium]|nr:response regulator [Phycisphaerales bacterium]
MPGSARDDRERLRHAPEVVRGVVESMDTAAAATAGDPEKRELNRFRYRVRELFVDIQQTPGVWKRFAVPTRNLSASGLSLIVGHFIYPRTRVRIHLISIYNHHTVQHGVVTRCRYVPATAGLHEVGVKFDADVDVGMFYAGVAPAKLLVVDSSPRMQKLMRAMLPEEAAQISGIREVDNITSRMQAMQFDLALVNADMEGLDAAFLARELRESGCVAPLVGYSASEQDELKQQCLDAGFDIWLMTPITRNTLSTVVSSLKNEPVISSLIHQHDMFEMIDQFAAAARNRAKEIQKLATQLDVPTLQRLVTALRNDADVAGFESIARMCDQVCELLTDSPDRGALRLKVNQLTRMCNAVRGISCAAMNADGETE